MNNFKPGDKVKCIHPVKWTDGDELIRGNIYTIVAIEDGQAKTAEMQNKSECNVCLARFELVQERLPQVFNSAKTQTKFEKEYNKHMASLPDKIAQAYNRAAQVVTDSYVQIDTHGHMIIGADYKQAFRDAVAYLDPGAIKRLQKLHPKCFEE